MGDFCPECGSNHVECVMEVLTCFKCGYEWEAKELEEPIKQKRLNIIISQLDYFFGAVELSRVWDEDVSEDNAMDSARRFIDELKSEYSTKIK